MKKIRFILFFTFLFVGNNVAKSQLVVDTLAIIDSLQQKYGLKNKVEILHYQVDEFLHAIVFKVDEKNSKLHEDIKSYSKKRFTESEINRFKHSYNPAKIPKHFQHIFIPVYKYQGSYYIYSPCDFVFMFEITSTYLALGYMDGAYAFPLNKFTKNSENNISLITDIENNEYTIEIIDTKNKIYRLKTNGTFTGYYTPLNNMGGLKIIAEECNVLGAIFESHFEKE